MKWEEWRHLQEERKRGVCAKSPERRAELSESDQAWRSPGTRTPRGTSPLTPGPLRVNHTRMALPV